MSNKECWKKSLESWLLLLLYSISDPSLVVHFSQKDFGASHLNQAVSSSSGGTHGTGAYSVALRLWESLATGATREAALLRVTENLSTESEKIVKK